ncbi:MAG: hypothetical protein C3F06_10580 [Candidatus Methanoperedenaceae archaeon]|nr:MAG: hypothetical protein C3F06_10580 [Candidatus Methanoperedenaceae archaeon]
MKFPKYIFAVGGAGKDIVYNMLEKDWILRDIIKPKNGHTEVNITIIDTALDEANERGPEDVGDIIKIKQFEKKIKDLQNEYRQNIESAQMSIGTIDIKYELLTSRMVLNTPHALIGMGDTIKRSTGTEVWWMNDPKLDDINLGLWSERVMDHENLRQQNFAMGVYRKRAIAKAIYYKAIAEGHFRPNIGDNEDVAILAGLGGGTGSGMTIDLAKRLKAIQPMSNIVLFGLLSTLKESGDEKANSFAMLSELEYTCVNKDKNIFKNIILCPIEQTQCRGRQTSRNEDKKLLEEYDDVFPQMFISYYNRGQSARDVFDTLPGYAPFVIATAQLVRYNINEIKKFRENVIEILQKKQASMIDETKIYTDIQKFIDEFYRVNDGVKAAFSDEDKLLIENRLSKFKSILQNEFFSKQLQYNSVIFLNDAMQAGIKLTKTNNVDDQIPNINSQIEAIAIPAFKDTVDETLFEVLKKDALMINELRITLSSVNKIQDIAIRNALKAVITNDKGSVGREINNIKNDAEDLKTDRATVEQALEGLLNKMAILDKDLNASIETMLKEWKEREYKNFVLLSSIDEFNIELNKDIIYLKSELKEYADKLNNTSKLSELKKLDFEKSIENIEEVLDKIYKELLSKIEFNFTDKGLIRECLRNLLEYRKNCIKYKKGVGFFDKLFKTREGENYKKLKSEIESLETRINRTGIFKVEKGLAVNTYKTNVDTIVQTKKTETVKSMIDDIRNMFQSASDETLLHIKDVLLDPVSRKEMDQNIIALIKEHKNYAAESTKIRSEISDTQKNLNAILERLKILDSLSPRLTAMPTILARYSGLLDKYHSYVENIKDHAAAIYDQHRKPIYVTDIQPSNVLQFMTLQNDINGMLRDNGEISNLKTKLEQGLSRTMDTKYNVMVKNDISSRDGQHKWRNIKAANSIVTIAKIVEPSLIGTEMRVRSSFGLQEITSYSDWVCQVGDPWEIGIVMFVGGVPLDNIVNVVDSGEGFRTHYLRSEPKVLFHHAYMLEEGKLVKRKKVLNIEVESDKATLLQDDSSVGQWFAQNYDILEIKKCL